VNRLGKSYFHELDLLHDSCTSALEANVSNIEKILLSIDKPLITLGSGGSFSVALLASRLFQSLGGNSFSKTPLELIQGEINTKNTNVLLVTASGRNKDIINSLKYVMKTETNNTIILCGSNKNRLQKIMLDNENNKLNIYCLPNGKDGFLAMNSIAFFSTILIKAYCNIFQDSFSESTINSIFKEVETFIIDLEKKGINYNEIQTYLALYGVNGKPAAYDFESKLTESGLSNVQLIDFRNFGHGRHNWINRKGNSTCIVSFVSSIDENISTKTLNLIPGNIEKITLSSSLKYPASILSLIIQTFYFVGNIAQHAGINPGKPSIPSFGRKLYHLNYRTKRMSQNNLLTESAIKRKIASFGGPTNIKNVLTYWETAYQSFIKDLSNATFRAIIFDYDGTLCRKHEKSIGLNKELALNLQELIDSNISIGIASGRGQSIRNDIQRIFPKAYWHKLHVCYYNGADYGLASDNKSPNKKSPIDTNLDNLIHILDREENEFLQIPREIRPKQITFTPELLNTAATWTLINEIIEKEKLKLKALISDHSIDVVPADISKLSLYYKFKNSIDLGKNEYIMCIGDKGKWPGNDYELLSTDHSLSVDSVSSSLNTCWNISPPGYRNVSACMKYLSAFINEKNKLKIIYSNLRT